MFRQILVKFYFRFFRNVLSILKKRDIIINVEPYQNCAVIIYERIEQYNYKNA